jgi:hypothetical protein
VFTPLPLVLDVNVGASGDCVDGFECWKVVALLGRFRLLCWWRW